MKLNEAEDKELVVHLSILILNK